ncbi:hypothetical protein LP419_31175 [Massilia sp. H-1]|nr:hypothetical protein LP419_31175 [Massilia sp. H-1]
MMRSPSTTIAMFARRGGGAVDQRGAAVHHLAMPTAWEEAAHSMATAARIV